ncbi:hypothetical protein PRUPE_4G206600 [Prunus persica]|uniref:DUF7788 domain-containing protein n=1 Tax=Prunus persica TaxID=3760 RepID=A0A251PNR6_PRUPE|nr:hypothetical protein PRUPE_4G206600 [Prunus persica]
MNCNSNEPMILEVFDLILEVAVKENLKAEQMIKKVIVFTTHLQPTDSRISHVQYDALRSIFETIRNKFRDKGYGDDAVPHILYFNEEEHPWICTQHPGFTIMSGKCCHPHPLATPERQAITFMEKLGKDNKVQMGKIKVELLLLLEK